MLIEQSPDNLSPNHSATFNSTGGDWLSQDQHTPQISVIIPVYNVEKYLPACLDSVLAQTFQDWEAICINDGSTDKCSEILRNYTNLDKRIICITQENKGVSAARNKGLQLAKGQFITFLDSDDEIQPDCYEKMYNAIQQTHADICWCDYQTGFRRSPKNKKYLKPNNYHTNIFAGFIQGKPDMVSVIWNKLYRREILKDILFKEKLPIGEDLFFLYQVLFKANSAIHIAEPLYFYRIRPGSAMHSGFSKNIIDGNIQTGIALRDYFLDKKMSPATQKLLNQKIAKRFFKFCVLEPARKDYLNRKKWYAYTCPLLKNLQKDGIYQSKHLNLRNRIRSYLFFKRF